MRFTRTTPCAIALAAVLSMPAFAQGTGPNNATPSTTGTTADSTLRGDDRGFNWGWLGLIGLAGLMGLRRSPDAHRASDATRASAPR